MKILNSFLTISFLKKFFLLFMLVSFQSFVYAQYKPFKLEYKGSADFLQKVVDADNRRRAEYAEMAINAINSATDALENKKYDFAIAEYKRSLELMEKSDLKYAEDYYETRKAINEAIEYCEYKKKNPYDNPLYKKWLGLYNTYFSSYDMYGYGSTSQLEFIAFGISTSEHIFIPRGFNRQVQIYMIFS